MKHILFVLTLLVGISLSASQEIFGQQVIFALTNSNQLVRFNSTTPGTVVTVGAVTGLTAGDTIAGIDFRPANSVLYGLGVNLATGTARVYSINTGSAAATLVASLAADPADTTPPFPFTTVSGTQFGVDFNPTVDRLRVTSNTGQNLRVNVDTGLVQVDLPLAYQSGDPNFGDSPVVTAVAYSNNLPSATTSVLRGVDIGQDPDLLVVHANPNGGLLQTSLSLPFNSAMLAYDISRASVPYFASTPSGGTSSSFFAGGVGGVTLVGLIGGGAIITALSAEPTGVTAGELIISEFRVRGPSGASDEFIEIYNNSPAVHTVMAASGSGYGVAASDGVTRCVIPNGTVIPQRAHYLCANSGAYSLSGYATADATYTTDIPDNAGIALFNNSTGGANYSLANRLDAVGSTSEANTVYKEGTGYPALTPFSIDYSFYRDNCGKNGSITTFGACPSAGDPVDTDNNAANFVFVDTNGTSAGAGQRLGAPGPENLASPIQRNSVFATNLLDGTVAASAPPNRVRDFTSDPANNSTFGTLSIRRRFVNNTGAPVTRLRFRIIDQTTFPAPSGIADLRARTSSPVVVSGVNDTASCSPAAPPCSVTVQGTLLEQPPSQPNGSAFNGSMSAGTVTLGTPLANAASINLQFLLGIQQTGNFKFFVNIEALP